MKQQILDALTNEWQATFIIVRKLRFNFYDVKEILEAMNEEGEVEWKAKNNINYWRLPISSKEEPTGLTAPALQST